MSNPIDNYNKIVTTVNSVTSDYSFEADANNLIVIDTSNNRIGINTVYPQCSIHISGGDVSAGIITPYLETEKITADGSINYVTSLINDHIFIGNKITLNSVDVATSTSDDRIKFNETLVTNGLDVINKIKIYKYDKVSFIGDTPDKNFFKKEIGVIAQEIQQIPELTICVNENNVSPNQEALFPNGVPLSIDYNMIYSYNIKATQELYSLIQTQSNIINQLEARLIAGGL